MMLSWQERNLGGEYPGKIVRGMFGETNCLGEMYWGLCGRNCLWGEFGVMSAGKCSEKIVGGCLGKQNVCREMS